MKDPPLKKQNTLQKGKEMQVININIQNFNITNQTIIKQKTVVTTNKNKEIFKQKIQCDNSSPIKSRSNYRSM
jgi:hypothetical protein